MFKHLLVPTDGSALSEAAIQMAVTLAREVRIPLRMSMGGGGHPGIVTSTGRSFESGPHTA